MVLTALRGGVGFLSRLPVGQDADAWAAFRTTPAVFPLVGYLLGVLAALPLLVPVPQTTRALLFVAWLYLVTGITHLDGVTDLGDALVVHGDADRRREVMTDTTVGVGGTLALVVVVAGLALGALSLDMGPIRVAGLVVATEVGAKLGMAAVACVGTATHEGLGSALTEGARPADFAVPLLAALPAVALTWPTPVAAGALAGTLLGTVAVVAVARRLLGGVSGDVFGATNEVARVVGLHAGVIVWMHW